MPACAPYRITGWAYGCRCGLIIDHPTSPDIIADLFAHHYRVPETVRDTSILMASLGNVAGAITLLTEPTHWEVTI